MGHIILIRCEEAKKCDAFDGTTAPEMGSQTIGTLFRAHRALLPSTVPNLVGQGNFRRVGVFRDCHNTWMSTDQCGYVRMSIMECPGEEIYLLFLTVF